MTNGDSESSLYDEAIDYELEDEGSDNRVGMASALDEVGFALIRVF